MAYTGSMTTGDLLAVIHRNNSDLKPIIGDRGQVGLYLRGVHVCAITQSGTLPPRTISDSDDVCEVRGWMDILAGLWGAGYLETNNELVRLLGRTSLDHVSRTSTLLLGGCDAYPSVIKRDRIPAKHKWMPRGSDEAA